MRQHEFPQANDFVSKIEERRKAAYNKKVDEQLLMIARRLESFDEDCDLENDCIKIPDADMGLCGIYSENMEIIRKSGWLVNYHQVEKQYVFKIKGLYSPNEV